MDTTTSTQTDATQETTDETTAAAPAVFNPADRGRLTARDRAIDEAFGAAGRWARRR